MKCKLCEDKLLEYLYGELGKEDAAAMEKHLEASDACRQAYEGFASVLETVAGENEEGPSPALHTRIMGHVAENRPARRSSWAWMFRPAVTTAVIGAVAAGVYFTALRHKPPSYLDERLLSEQSPVRKSTQRSAPQPPGGIEREEAASEPFEEPEKKGSAKVTPPPGRQDRSVPTNSLDEELAPAQERKKVQAVPAEEDHAVPGGTEGAPSPTSETRAVPMAVSSSQGRDLAYEEAPVPSAIEQTLNLASEGQCVEAEKMIETYATDHPKEKASGSGWLEVARCFSREGDTKAARETAEKALEIPAYESEARAFLDSLPP
jgi:hypothetical protein